jgi:hypothetical protein
MSLVLREAELLAKNRLATTVRTEQTQEACDFAGNMGHFIMAAIFFCVRMNLVNYNFCIIVCGMAMKRGSQFLWKRKVKMYQSCSTRVNTKMSERVRQAIIVFRILFCLVTAFDQHVRGKGIRCGCNRNNTGVSRLTCMNSPQSCALQHLRLSITSIRILMNFQ